VFRSRPGRETGHRGSLFPDQGTCISPTCRVLSNNSSSHWGTTLSTDL
jgi:hypothetical protein